MTQPATHSYPASNWAEGYNHAGLRAVRFRPGERVKAFSRMSEILQQWSAGDASEEQAWERILQVIRRAKARGSERREAEGRP